MKKFLIVGNMNAITYKEVFPLIRDDIMWLGMTGGSMQFRVPSDYPMRSTRSWRDEDGQNWRSLGNSCWYTNLTNSTRLNPLALSSTVVKYSRYDNYDAIEVSKVSEIPDGYNGIMGVPITFLTHYCPEQFTILGHEHDVDGKGTSVGQFEVNGTGVYKRILIKRR